MKEVQSVAELEVVGACIGAVVDGFKQYPTVAMRFLASHGLIDADATSPSQLRRDQWYPLSSWLAAYYGIAAEVGHSSLYTIGKCIPDNAPFPVTNGSLLEALRSIDVAYHMSHRKNGKVMYDIESSSMLDGIGNYKCERTGEREITCVCDNPYPCDFDLGLIESIALRCDEFATTEHCGDRDCRKHGDPTCTYLVTW